MSVKHPYRWPCPIVQRMMLEKAIAKFLRTHRGGLRMLLDWVAAEPADRTEEEFVAEEKAKADANEKAIEDAFAEINAQRLARGLRPLGLDGYEIEEPPPRA